jgi:HEAT repeat protein
MPKRRLIIAVLAVAILAALIFTLTGPREPVYNGRTLSAWLEEIDRNSREGLPTQQAREAINQIGANAVPCFLNWIRFDPPAWKDKLPGFLSDNERFRAQAAAEGFAILGLKAKTAIPDLIHTMRTAQNQDVMLRAGYALAHLGPEAMPPLVTALTNPSQTLIVRSLLASYISKQGTNAGLAVPGFIQCLSDTNPLVAANAARCLGELRLEPASVIPALTRSLDHSSPLVRKYAATGLGEYAQNGVPALPRLMEVLHDSDRAVRSTATNALRKIAPEVLTNVPSK